MMREKINIYEQFAQTLLGDKSSRFRAPFNSSDSANDIDVAMFVGINRLFSRDGIKRETFAMQWYQTSSQTPTGSSDPFNLNITSERGLSIYTDAGSSGNKELSFGGNVGGIVDSSNTDRTVGLMFYDHGVAVFDLEKIISGTERAYGIIDAMSNASTGTTAGTAVAGQTILGAPGGVDRNATFIPDFITSASMDNIIDYFASTRFSSGTNSSMVLQNLTNIQSTIIFCRAEADEFNYSSNPTFVDSDNRIVVIDEGQEENQQSFTMITSVGLYDANDNLLGIGKLSRPVEKNPEKDLTIRARLDF
jgi:hypothetical protein